MSMKITAEQARSLQRNACLARAEFRRNQVRALDPLTVDGLLFDDNLVPISLLDQGLSVHIPAWDRAQAGDELRVKWDGLPIFRLVLSDPATELPYDYHLPAERLLLDGAHQLSYNVKAISGTGGESPAFLITVDHAPPNYGNIPGALTFPEEVMTDGITAQYLADNDDKVVATVPPYAKMEADQSVSVVWDISLAVPKATVLPEHVDVGVPVDIPGDIIRAGGDGPIDVTYYLTSRAGLDGAISQHSFVDVILSAPPSGLLPPSVPLAADGIVDLTDADVGVIIEVPAYQNAGAGDLVAASWGTAALALYPMPLDGLPAEIAVPRATVLSVGNGDISVSYQIMRNGHPFSADPITVKVDVTQVGPVDPDPSTPENESLAKPTVRGGVSGLANELDPSDAAVAAQVTVPMYDEAKVGEIVTVHWGSGSSASVLTPYAITQADIDAETIPAFLVDVPILQAMPNDPAWPLHYTLSRPQGSATENPVLSPTQTINAHMVGPGGQDGLPPATFPDINEAGWLLRPTVDPDGAKVKVAAYENMQVGDVVSLEWAAYSTTNTQSGSEISGAQFTDDITVTAETLGKDLDFVVPFEEYIQPIETESDELQGSALVTYVVTPEGEDIEFRSEQATVKIELFEFVEV